MATYSGPATLKQAQHEISASVAYSSEAYPGFESWQGTFATDDGINTLVAGPATLRLTDGRESVVRVWPTSLARGRGVFHGRI